MGVEVNVAGCHSQLSEWFTSIYNDSCKKMCGFRSPVLDVVLYLDILTVGQVYLYCEIRELMESAIIDHIVGVGYLCSFLHSSQNQVLVGWLKSNDCLRSVAEATLQEEEDHKNSHLEPHLCFNLMTREEKSPDKYNSVSLAKTIQKRVYS